VRVVENVPLAPLTTLQVGGPARRLVHADREADVAEILQESDASQEPLLVLGGGSNLVVGDAGFAGTVLRMETRGIAIEPATAGPGAGEGGGDRVEVTVQAGEEWDAFVERMVAEGLSGVECLGGIPGRVGAVPMQNVGAYGQDVGETIVRVRILERGTGRIVELDREACGFSYRSSAFRGRTDRVILAVTFALAREALSAPIRYAELSRALRVEEGGRVPLALARETVIRLRRGKGMVLDPSDADTVSAGSFFTNPVLDAAALEALAARVAPILREGERMPTFPEAGRTKVSAAWLIERAGFRKGFTKGPVAVSSKHALALTNRGGATTADLLALAREIRDGVRARFGVTLENEPVMVGGSR